MILGRGRCVWANLLVNTPYCRIRVEEKCCGFLRSSVVVPVVNLGRGKDEMI